MKRLTILRHAKSQWNENGLADFNRPLNKQGWKAARRMGHELRIRKMQFDLVLASTAARVRETIDGLQEEFEFTAPIRFDQPMYLATEKLLLQMVRQLPETVQSPLLVGHNPGLQQLLLALSKEDEDGLRDLVRHKFPTAALAVIDLVVDRWNEVAPATGRIAELIRPKELA